MSILFWSLGQGGKFLFGLHIWSHSIMRKTEAKAQLGVNLEAGGDAEARNKYCLPACF